MRCARPDRQLLKRIRKVFRVAFSSGQSEHGKKREEARDNDNNNQQLQYFVHPQQQQKCGTKPSSYLPRATSPGPDTLSSLPSFHSMRLRTQQQANHLCSSAHRCPELYVPLANSAQPAPAYKKALLSCLEQQQKQQTPTITESFYQSSSPSCSSHRTRPPRCKTFARFDQLPPFQPTGAATTLKGHYNIRRNLYETTSLTFSLANMPSPIPQRALLVVLPDMDMEPEIPLPL